MILKKIKCYQPNNNISYLAFFKDQILIDLEKV